MKFLERALLLMYLLGLYFALVQKPADYSLLLVSTAALALLYLLCMVLLLQQITFKDLGQRAVRTELSAGRLICGFLFGIFSAYFVFSTTYHNLGKMETMAFAENCGLLLLLFAGTGFFFKKKTAAPFYHYLLMRTAVMGIIMLVAITLKFTLLR